LGSLRLRKTLETYQVPTLKLRELMENQVNQTVSQILQQLPQKRSVELIALGGDIRFAVSELVPDWKMISMAKVPLAALKDYTENILKLSVDELVQRYHLSFPDAESIGPALLAYVQLAAALKVTDVHVTPTSLRDGLLKEMATHSTWTGEFREQVVRSALELGKKFDFDEEHGTHVAELSSKLFAELQNEHGLDNRYELILYVSALLFEVGLFISNRSYHKHSMYLIRNSEMFGLSKNDQLLVSLVARYHRRASPQPTHEGYGTLPRDLRVAVSKMAALLRVAMTLDASRSQRIQQFECLRQKDQLVITVAGVDDLSLEQLSLRQSGTLYEEIFGTPVLLRKGRR
jgi:exopolyphosphatase/guanosine-5'-triphosphate,3'-diphosphate pyrophosphatase